MKRLMRLCLLSLLASLSVAPESPAFCGFYVAKADSKLFNKASRVVITHNKERNVLTMANDYEGELKEFAIVIPSPTVLQREQIHIGNPKTVDHIDAYTAPRLVEYFDEDPCNPVVWEHKSKADGVTALADKITKYDVSHGVKIEAKYTIGEYDIIILSATESSGLENWLKDNGYRIPAGATEVLGSYIKQGMKFFVAKVNLAEQAKTGFKYLRPIQIAFESPKFMLPIRLGTVNANGYQELFIYFLTKKGRVETTNYRTVKIPTDIEVPEFVKDTFGEFYRGMIEEQFRKENKRVVFQEYVWNMSWCDPCAAEPLSNDELKELGVFWLTDRENQGRGFGGPNEVLVTRLHLKYSGETFPEDLFFQETSDQANFQGRYIMRHPWKGDVNCDAAKEYSRTLATRSETHAQNLASLTGWDITGIRKRMRIPEPETPWWKKLWKN